MAWPIKNAAYTFYVTLVDSAARPAFKADPTLAAGDVKVSIDGGAFANLGTLPDAEPNAGRAIRVIMAQAEMNGDNIMVQFVDAAGAEWDDLIVHIQTTARGIDDVATQSSVNVIDGIVDDILVDTAEIGAAGAGLTNINLPNQTMDIVGNITGNLSGSVGSVTGLTAANLDATVSSRATQASVDDLPTNAELATALGTADDAVLAAVNDLPTNAELATALAAADDAVLAAIAALNDLTAAEIADGILNRDMSAGTDSGSDSVRTVRQALRVLRNKWSVAATTITYTKEDDTTTTFTAELGTSAGVDPVTSSDPAGP